MEYSTQSQEEVLSFLAAPASYGASKVQRIDTHASTVFLAGKRALKVKRAVRFPFLEYSTLERRKTACAAELDVNRPFAADLYRRIVPITRERDGRLALEGEGEPIEWAVEMERFDENCTFDHLAARGAIDAPLADALGRAVAAGHARAPIVEAEPWIEALGSYLDQNQAVFRDIPDLFVPQKAALLDRASQAALKRLRPLLCRRGELGLIRRGHGDLHLGNIALLQGQPVAFDAIEFSPLVAAGDVLYDLAFLLMDLINRELNQAANIVLNRYLVETQRREDLDGLAALPFYLSLRAAIRAKVTAARLPAVEPPQRPGIGEAARTYFRLACSLIQPAPPMLIAIGGLSGTGKSVLARELAPHLLPPPGAVVLRSDAVRKAMFCADETERLPVSAYRSEVADAVYAALEDKARRAIVAGHSAIVDAVFADAGQRVAIGAVAGSASFHGLFLETDLATRLDRVGTRKADASDADVAIARQQQAYDLGNMDWARIDASGNPAQTLASAKMMLGIQLP